MMMSSLKVTLPTIVNVAVLLPAGSILSCIFLSLWVHGEKATSTHCGVPNYLPSISAAVGKDPAIFVFRICIGLHSSLRLCLAFVYCKFYHNAAELSNKKYIGCGVKLNFLFHIIEVFSLVLLTDVSSTENYDVHKTGFIGFVLFSLLYMPLTCLLFFKLGEVRYNKKNYRSLKLKLIFLVTAILSLFLLAYFFWRHNKYCEAGIYSLFAFFEYAFVFSNIAFHWTAVYDFQDVTLESCAALTVFPVWFLADAKFQILMNGVQYSGLKKGLLDDI